MTSSAHLVSLPPPCMPGDRVAVVSPSWAAPAYFPALHEQAMRRVREDLGLEPVEYPSTRMPSTPARRAADLMAAFLDPSITAILATIGGDDQLTVLPHLDAAVVQRNPKRFLGYSDNTNLLNWLWFHGIGAIHGGSTQVHLGPGPHPDPVHLSSLRAALFGGSSELRPLSASWDHGISWQLDQSLNDVPPTPDDDPGEARWTWHGPPAPVRGRTWGGNLEVLQWVLGVGRHVLPSDAYAGCVLLLETSEERPSASEVTRMMRVLGERGLLGAAAAVVVARPQAAEVDDDPGTGARRHYREAQREAALNQLQRYAPGIPGVVGVEFGHTRPQYLLPHGGYVTLDPANNRIVAEFGAPGPLGTAQEAQGCG